MAEGTEQREPGVQATDDGQSASVEACVTAAADVESPGTGDAESTGSDQSEDASMRFFGGTGDRTSAEMGSTGAETSPLEAQLQAALAQAEEQRNAHLRAVAEMQNVRKRFERESQQARQFAIEGFARDLLMVADNLERALDAVPKECSAELNMFREGVAMTQNELARAFGKHGLSRIQALNEPFDPNLHQAVLQVEDASLQPGTVVREMQTGYLLNGRLLRPSMVGVSRQPEEQPDPEEGSAGSEHGA
ncbi:MAG: nucleotide exchange factor GrpE [Magnetococcus sp. MYC-9]